MYHIIELWTGMESHIITTLKHVWRAARESALRRQFQCCHVVIKTVYSVFPPSGQLWLNPDNVVLLGFQFETINFYNGYILVKYEKKFGIKQRLIVFIINNAAWFNPPPLPPPGHTPQDLQFFSYMAVCSLPPESSSDHLKKYPLGQRRLDLSQGLAEGVENGSRSTLTMHHAFGYTSKAVKDEMNIVSPW